MGVVGGGENESPPTMMNTESSIELLNHYIVYRKLTQHYMLTVLVLTLNTS